MMLMQRNQRRIAPALGRSTSLMAPVKGWNARDSLADMDPAYGVIVQNWVPRNTYLEVRNGYTQYATGFTGWCETVMQYSGGSTSKLFAAVGSKIYDISAGGAVGAAVVSTLTNARWQYVNNTTAGGSYIQMVNGADKMRVFDGTNWHIDGDGPPYDVTGLNTATATNIALAHNRVWFTQASTLKAWYLPTGAIGGAATALDLSSFCFRGGYLMAIADWTMDAGYGMDDMTAFITSNGEVLVYRGSDPSSSSTWGLIGVYWIGSPIGRRCACKYQGDLLIISQDGVQPMSLALQSSRINARISLTNIIQLAVSQAVSSYGSNFGWQLQPFPKENLLFLNVPLQESAIQQQYVMNTITQAWSNFTNWNAACWELYNDNIYFGGNGYVGKAWDGLSDAGGNIMSDGLQAFNSFKSPGVNKQFTQMQPVLNTNGTPAISAQMNLDFDLSAPTASVAFSSQGNSLWDVGKWDQAKWANTLAISERWQGATGVGKYAAPHLVTNSQGINIQWSATNVIWTAGGML